MRLLIKAAIVVVVLAIGLWFGYAKLLKTETKNVNESPVLYIDDIDSAVSDAADEFESAFALESTCHGLTLMRWSRIKENSDAAIKFYHTPHWELYIHHLSNPGPPNLNYAMSMVPPT